jgi:hypothetical protein
MPGHTIVRQGFDTYQVQGVRSTSSVRAEASCNSRPLPVRRTPQPLSETKAPITFVKDSSIDD